MHLFQGFKNELTNFLNIDNGGRMFRLSNHFGTLLILSTISKVSYFSKKTVLIIVHIEYFAFFDKIDV